MCSSDLPAIPAILPSAPCIRRHPVPVLSREQVPYDATLIFNAGVCKVGSKYAMIFRNDVGTWQQSAYFKATNIGLALSDDGVNWKVTDKPVWDQTDQALQQFAQHDVVRVYDPRLIEIEGRYYVCFACDTRHGLRGGVAVTDDFKKFEVLSLSVPDNRNMILFPERINGKYIRLERPMPVYSRGKDRFDIWYSDSPDMKYWGNEKLVLGVESVPYANDKVGPAAPPIRTKKGWLTTIHAVDREIGRAHV